jgi:hypothetical protein
MASANLELVRSIYTGNLFHVRGGKVTRLDARDGCQTHHAC